MPVVIECEERVVLLGGETRLWLEPVREVSHAAGDRPFLDHLGDDGRDGKIEFLAVSNGGSEAGENIPRQFVAQLPDAESIDPEVLRCRSGYAILVEAGRDAGLAAGDFGQQSFARSYRGGGGHGWRLNGMWWLRTANHAHFHDQIGYCRQNMQGIGIDSCRICKKLPTRLR